MKWPLTPPQLSVLARSLPVPRGSTATGGGGFMPRLSMVDSIQPAVPSPPQARILKLGTLRNISSLQNICDQINALYGISQAYKTCVSILRHITEYLKPTKHMLSY